MTKYLITIVESEWDPQAVTDEQWAEVGAQHGAFSAAAVAAGGSILAGEALEPAAKGYRIDPRLKDTAVGALDDTEDVITGFYLVELPDDVDAEPILATCPTEGHLDIRPVADIPG